MDKDELLQEIQIVKNSNKYNPGGHFDERDRREMEFKEEIERLNQMIKEQETKIGNQRMELRKLNVKRRNILFRIYKRVNYYIRKNDTGNY